VRPFNPTEGEEQEEEETTAPLLLERFDKESVFLEAV